jgi:hypothetical protein
MPSPIRHALIALSCAASLTGAQAASYEGQAFPDALQLGGSPLVLNGTGKRQVVVSLYFAALYLPHKAGTPDGVYSQTGPKRLEMRIVIPMVKDVSTQEFVKAINVGVERNCGEAERAAVAERVKTFNSYISAVDRVKKGDLLLIDYLPGQGTVLTVNGKSFGKPVEGEDFYVAFLKVFLGDRPSDKRLRAGLLGQAG